ncbi:MAG: hypothetical protein BWK79_14550 [Beggiatoa sp. IS2]|nr:MAG: hypothetical protein BWK79_14550 [Beggiatoa sp. IS2]
MDNIVIWFGYPLGMAFASTSKLNQPDNYFANWRDLLFLKDSFEMSTELRVCHQSSQLIEEME